MTVKPHKGSIVIIGKSSAEGHGLGYLYWVRFIDHPQFGNGTGHTSYIVKDATDVPRHRGDSYEIETRNSRYTVIPNPEAA